MAELAQYRVQPCGAQPSPPAGTVSLVFAIGRIEPQFPRLSIEKEFAQATSRANTAGLTDSAVLRKVLSQRENRYLARHLCWLMTINGVESYVAAPADAGDVDLLIESLRPRPEPTDLDVLIGVQTEIAPPEMCNGLRLPIVVFDQLYSFDRASLLDALPSPGKDIAKDQALAAAAELLDRILGMTENTGRSAAHRALNYLAVRYPPIYALTAEAYANNAALTSVEVRPETIGVGREIVAAILSFTNRRTDVVSKHAVRVDVSDRFPFIVSKLSPYYDRP